jgi:hypothetical protein
VYAQRTVSFTTGMGAIAIVFIFVYLVIMALPMPRLDAVAMPQVQIPTYKEHQQDRHSDVIAASVSCFSGNGTVSIKSTHRDSDEHDAWMCQMNGKIYIWIVDKLGNTVTQFQNKAKTFEEALEYLGKQGYHLPLP